MSASTFEIPGRPHLRTLAIAAGVAVLGMLLLTLTALFDWGQGGVTLGVALAGLGIGLVIVSQESARRSGVKARLDDQGFVLASNRTHYAKAWKDIAKVTMSANRLTLKQTDGHEVAIVAPPGSRPEELDRLAHALATHLDADRGYRPFI